MTDVLGSKVEHAKAASHTSVSAATACSPQREVIFINVVGCGTRPPSGTRANLWVPENSVTSLTCDFG
jgi:hypothetical protein